MRSEARNNSDDLEPLLGVTNHCHPQANSRPHHMPFYLAIVTRSGHRIGGEYPWVQHLFSRRTDSTGQQRGDGLLTCASNPVRTCGADAPAYAGALRLVSSPIDCTGTAVNISSLTFRMSAARQAVRFGKGFIVVVQRAPRVQNKKRTCLKPRVFDVRPVRVHRRGQASLWRLRKGDGVRCTRRDRENPFVACPQQ